MYHKDSSNDVVDWETEMEILTCTKRISRKGVFVAPANLKLE